MLKTLLRLWAVVVIAIKRLLAHHGLALATLIGLVVIIALVMSIPLYAEATYYRMLSEGLFSNTPQYRGLVVRPPVALLFRYSGSFTVPIQWENIAPLDTYFTVRPCPPHWRPTCTISSSTGWGPTRVWLMPATRSAAETL